MPENDKEQDHNTESHDSVAQSRFRSLMERARRMRANEQYTGLVITCNGHEWKVHKLCLCAQSDFFQSACGSSFKEGNKSKIDLDDDDPETVEALIHYFYSFSYGEHANTANIILDARVYAAADKYFVAPLKQLAKKKFESRAKAEWKTIEFADAVAEVYSIIPEGDGELRRIVLATVEQHADELLDKLTPTSQHFLHVLRKQAELGLDIATGFAFDRIRSRPRRYECPYCTLTFSICLTTEPGCTHMFNCPRRCQLYLLGTWEDKYRYDQ